MSAYSENNYDLKETGTRIFFPDIKVKKKILVIDDDENIRELLKLSCSKTYSVSTAETCKSAIELMVETMFNLALVDVYMEGMNGLEFLTYCRKNCPYMQIILMTGRPVFDDAVNSIKEGAYDYIAKPMDLKKLNDKIESAIMDQEKQLKHTEEQVVNSDFFQMKNYKILKSLGAGNSGLVLLVEKEGKKYAMKIMRKKGTLEQHNKAVKRFLRESEIMKKMNNECIVKVYEYDILKDTDVPYIIMEYVDGCQLSEYITNNAMNIEHRIYILKQLASALDYIHSHGVLHRDIKPENVMITQNMQVKITDFGIAKTQDSSLTMTNDIMGSPHYMAPECFDSAKSLDKRSDIFSLGALSYELLTCQRAFPGDNVFQVMEAIKSKKPVEPRKINPNIPNWLQNIVAKMMSKTPDDRYPTAGKILESIEFNQENEDNEDTLKETRTSRFLRSMLLLDNPWS